MKQTRRKGKAARGKRARDRAAAGEGKSSLPGADQDDSDLSLAACCGCQPWRVFVRADSEAASDVTI